MHSSAKKSTTPLLLHRHHSSVTRRRHIDVPPLPPHSPGSIVPPVDTKLLSLPSIFPLFAIEGGPPPLLSPLLELPLLLGKQTPNRPSSTLPCPCLMSPSFVISLSASPSLLARHSSHDTAAGVQPTVSCVQACLFQPRSTPPSSGGTHWPKLHDWSLAPAEGVATASVKKEGGGEKSGDKGFFNRGSMLCYTESIRPSVRQSAKV